MKKLFIGLIALCISMIVYSKDRPWKIEEITDNNHIVVGYIYHIEAVGTQTGISPEKVVSSIRLVCSTLTYQEGDQLIVLFWDTANENTIREITIKADNTIFGLTAWNQIGPVMIRPVIESQEIINLFKTNKTIRFSWNNENIGGTAIFDFTTFNTRLGEFNTRCKTNL